MTTNEQGRIQFDWQQPGRYSTNAVKLASLTVDGFDVTVRVEYDYDHDWTEFRGKFVSTWEEGAIKNPNARYDNRIHKYFVPENTLRCHLKGLLKMGYSAQEARKEAVRYVKEDMQICIDPAEGNCMAVGVIATCSLKGVELGENSLWGIEVEYDDKYNYIDSCARDCINEALVDAKEKLEKLRAAE